MFTRLGTRYAVVVVYTDDLPASSLSGLFKFKALIIDGLGY